LRHEYELLDFIIDYLSKYHPEYHAERSYYLYIDGHPTRKLEMDIVIYHKETKDLIAVIELDGPHHFSAKGQYYAFLSTPEENQTAFKKKVRYDQLKNNHFQRRLVAMLRIHFIHYKDKNSWTTRFLDDVFAGDTSLLLSHPAEYKRVYRENPLVK